jgi:hypothetical protein
MTAQIIWNISVLDCKPTEGSLTDVVVTAHWQCNGTQVENGQTYTASVYSTASFTQPDDGNFTPYQDLTQQQVLGWVWANGVDKDATEAAVQQQIANQINPPIVTPALPWATQA